MPLFLAVVPVAFVEVLRRRRAMARDAVRAEAEAEDLNLEETRLIHEERRADLERLRDEIERIEARAEARYSALEQAERECQDDRDRLRTELGLTNARLLDLERRVREGRPENEPGGLDLTRSPRQAAGGAA